MKFHIELEKLEHRSNTKKVLIKSATLKITEIVLGKEAMKKINQVLMSNHVVTSRHCRNER